MKIHLPLPLLRALSAFGKHPWWLAGSALLCLIILTVFVTGAFTAKKPGVNTAPAGKGTIEITITALGSLEPKEYVDVGTQVSGLLEKLHVDIGDIAEKGQLLAEIDATVYETRVRNARAGLENMKAQLALQQAELELALQRAARSERLYKQNAVSEDTLEASKTDVTVGRARITALRAQIDAADAALDGDIASLGYTKIYAPMAGTIVSVNGIEGQTLNATQTAPTIVRIANLAVMTVRAQVSEADVVKITPDMPVYFSTLGMPERRWRGKVRKILPTPETVNDVVLYHVLVDVDNEDNALMTSMTAQVFFVLGRARDVLVVPVSALKTSGGRRSNPDYTVDVKTQKGIETREVKVGLISRIEAEIISGIAEGEEVIIGTAFPDMRRDARPNRDNPGGVRMRGPQL